MSTSRRQLTSTERASLLLLGAALVIAVAVIALRQPAEATSGAVTPAEAEAALTADSASLRVTPADLKSSMPGDSLKPAGKSSVKAAGKKRSPKATRQTAPAPPRDRLGDVNNKH